MTITDEMVEMVREQLEVPDVVPDEHIHDIIYQIMGDFKTQIKRNLPNFRAQIGAVLDGQ